MIFLSNVQRRELCIPSVSVNVQHIRKCFKWDLDLNHVFYGCAKYFPNCYLF
jgi:hypothetical protein